MLLIYLVLFIDSKGVISELVMTMRRERNDIRVGPTVPYTVTSYDEAFIVLKGNHEGLKKRLKWSETKQKFFLRGKIIEWLIESEDRQHIIKSYPLHGSISFVDHRDWLMYSTCKWNKAKEEKILHIHYSWIDYILLDFNSLEWKK